jgi:hypothetical protein
VYPARTVSRAAAFELRTLRYDVQACRPRLPPRFDRPPPRARWRARDAFLERRLAVALEHQVGGAPCRSRVSRRKRCTLAVYNGLPSGIESALDFGAADEKTCRSAPNSRSNSTAKSIASGVSTLFMAGLNRDTDGKALPLHRTGVSRPRAFIRRPNRAPPSCGYAPTLRHDRTAGSLPVDPR